MNLTILHTFQNIQSFLLFDKFDIVVDSEEDMPHIFDRFYKSDRSRGLDKSGSGLGLYIAKTVIEAQDEKIFVRSREGEYCEFVFTLKENS